MRDGRAERGVLVCGSGAGVAVAATKMVGIRAATVNDTYTAHQAVEHDDVNVLCLGARVIGPALAADILRAFAAASFTRRGATPPPRGEGEGDRARGERMRVIECDFCGQTLSAANDEELVAHGRRHMDERHAGEGDDAARVRELVAEHAYEATDS